MHEPDTSFTLISLPTIPRKLFKMLVLLLRYLCNDGPSPLVVWLRRKLEALAFGSAYEAQTLSGSGRI